MVCPFLSHVFGQSRPFVSSATDEDWLRSIVVVSTPPVQCTMAAMLDPDTLAGLGARTDRQRLLMMRRLRLRILPGGKLHMSAWMY